MVGTDRHIRNPSPSHPSKAGRVSAVLEVSGRAVGIDGEYSGVPQRQLEPESCRDRVVQVINFIHVPAVAALKMITPQSEAIRRYIEAGPLTVCRVKRAFNWRDVPKRYRWPS